MTAEAMASCRLVREQAEKVGREKGTGQECRQDDVCMMKLI